ncbi:DUF2784 domain-containing protein [Aidingimonas lacisalsi]|uniref:DUF2784 domain-containing protein n=1 Tax=Aidingimonas lacisalsi TaxID=2604086 RepID=UPI0011D1A779|nr:DUF2784 domain-containing protein [Aidingimonas lacisalsi]
MLYRLAADLLLVIHLAFIVFVVLGGIAVSFRHKVAWAHLPAAIWGTVVELGGFYCPLTPWENRLRQLGGEAGYAGGFIEHYLLPILYPPGLTPTIQMWLGVAVVAINLPIYIWVMWRYFH